MRVEHTKQQKQPPRAAHKTKMLDLPKLARLTDLQAWPPGPGLVSKAYEVFPSSDVACGSQRDSTAHWQRSEEWEEKKSSA